MKSIDIRITGRNYIKHRKIRLWVFLGVLLLTSSCEQPTGSPDNEPGSIPSKVVTEMSQMPEIEIFRQDINKSYTSLLGRPWVLAKPLHEFEDINLSQSINE